MIFVVGFVCACAAGSVGLFLNGVNSKTEVRKGYKVNPVNE